jgi:peroxiredoxin
MTKLVLAFLFVAVVKVNAQEKPEGLFINSKAPDFKAKDQNGNDVVLKDLRKKGPVIIVFYRGYWCPYCNKELQRLQDSLESIKKRGAQLIAVTPETQDGIAKTLEKTKVSYSIISDEEIKIMRAYKVAFQVDEKTIARYKMANIDLAANNGHKPNAVYLPVPAVYIINKDGEVAYRFFDADYKNQASVTEIINNLTGLK